MTTHYKNDCRPARGHLDDSGAADGPGARGARRPPRLRHQGLARLLDAGGGPRLRAHRARLQRRRRRRRAPPPLPRRQRARAHAARRQPPARRLPLGQRLVPGGHRPEERAHARRGLAARHCRRTRKAQQVSFVEFVD